jgi:hypothetical protein
MLLKQQRNLPSRRNIHLDLDVYQESLDPCVSDLSLWMLSCAPAGKNKKKLYKLEINEWPLHSRITLATD